MATDSNVTDDVELFMYIDCNSSTFGPQRSSSVHAKVLYVPEKDLHGRNVELLQSSPVT